MKAGFIFLCCIISFSVLAANPVKVVVKDEKNEPIIGAVIESEEENQTAFTDFVGEAIVQPNTDEVIYKIESVGYETVYVKLLQKNNVIE